MSNFAERDRVADMLNSVKHAEWIDLVGPKAGRLKPEDHVVYINHTGVCHLTSGHTAQRSTGVLRKPKHAAIPAGKTERVKRWIKANVTVVSARPKTVRLTFGSEVVYVRELTE
jgi:hypothetical protein